MATITVLRPTSTDKVLTKQYAALHGGGIGRNSYDRVKWFTAKTIAITDINALSKALEILIKQPNRCYIRGKLISKYEGERVRRLLHQDKKEGPFFEPKPSPIIGLDFDGIKYGGDTVADPEAAIRFLISKLPAEFHNASCHWAFTSSHGAPDKKGTIRARLHYYGDRQFDDEELKTWAKWVNSEAGERLIDPSLFNPVQVCYTASPVFIRMADWCPVRSGFIRGERDDVPLVLAPTVEAPTQGVRTSEHRDAGRTEAQGFEDILALVGGPDGYRSPLWRAMLSWWRSNGVNADPAPLVRRLTAVCAAVPESERSAVTLAGYISDDQIERARVYIAENPITDSDVEDFDDLTAGPSLPTADECSALYRTAFQGWLAGPVAIWRSGDADALCAGPPQAAAAVGTGIGKTTVTLDELIRTELRVAFFVPSHLKTGEVMEDINRMAGAPIAARWLGRDRFSPNDGSVRMCPLNEAVDVLGRAGGSAERLCGGAKRGWCQHHPKNPKVEMACAYKGQGVEARIWVLPHSMLSMTPPASFGSFDLVVIDESPWLDMAGGGAGYGVALDGIKLAGIKLLEREDRQGTAAAYPPLAATVAAVLASVEPGRLPMAPLLAAEVTATACLDAMAVCYASKVDVDKLVAPGMSKEDVEKALGTAAAKNSRVLRVAKFWRQLAQSIASGAPISAYLKRGIIGESEGIIIAWREEIAPAYLNLPILHLDATLNETIARWFLPSLEVIARLEASTPHATVRQVFDSTVGYGKLAPKSSDNETVARTKVNNLRRIGRRLEVQAEKNGNGLLAGTALAIMPLTTKDALSDAKLVPEGVDVSHWFGCRGVDRWRLAPSLEVFSRPLPSPDIVEELATVLSGTVPEKTISVGGWYLERNVKVRTRSGDSKIIGASRHPDPAVEAVRWQRCEAEIIQGVGRARACRRTDRDPVEILIGTNVPLRGIPITEFVTWNSIFPCVVDLMVSRGIVVGNSADIATILPDMWRDSVNRCQAVKDYFRNRKAENDRLKAILTASRWDSPTKNHIGESHRDAGGTHFRYRKKGERYFHSAFSPADELKAARRTLAAALGAEIEIAPH